MGFMPKFEKIKKQSDMSMVIESKLYHTPHHLQYSLQTLPNSLLVKYLSKIYVPHCAIFSHMDIHPDASSAFFILCITIKTYLSG